MVCYISTFSLVKTLIWYGLLALNKLLLNLFYVSFELLSFGCYKYDTGRGHPELWKTVTKESNANVFDVIHDQNEQCAFFCFSYALLDTPKNSVQVSSFGERWWVYLSGYFSRHEKHVRPLIRLAPEKIIKGQLSAYHQLNSKIHSFSLKNWELKITQNKTWKLGFFFLSVFG